MRLHFEALGYPGGSTNEDDASQGNKTNESESVKTDFVGTSSRPYEMKSCLPSLTGLRALAALTVLFSHFAGSGGSLGQLGVQLFFILSGYLMCLLYMEVPRGHSWAARILFGTTFFYNRFVRIAPLALLVLGTSSMLRLMPTKHLNSYAVYATDIPLLDILILRSAPGIMWTIAVELAFYIMFSSMLTLPKRVACLLMRTIAVLSILSFFLSPKRRFENLTGLRWGLVTEKAYVYKFFALGVLCYEIHRFVATTLRTRMPRSTTKLTDKVSKVCEIAVQLGASGLLIGFIMFRCYYWHSLKGTNNWNDIQDALAICALLLGSLYLWPVRAILSLHPLQHLGKISYSLYLTHMFVFNYFSRHSWASGKTIGFTFFILVNGALSTLLFRAFEQPSGNLLRSRGASSKMPEWVMIDQMEALPTHCDQGKSNTL